MNECTRFEDEGLQILEEGGALDAHFETCEACIKARASYDGLKRMLTGLDADVTPDDGWENNVLSEVQSTPAPESTMNRGWLGAIAAGIGAIAIVGTLLIMGGREPGDSGRIEIAVSSGGTIYRGEDANPGDRLTITAQVGASSIFEVRIYRDGERLVLTCADQAPCEHSDDTITATVELQALGEYQAVLILSEDALPAAGNNLDADVLAIRDSGATVTLSDTVRVR